ncbi:hypothetical protein YC2023_117247 [Brassica napus]
MWMTSHERTDETERIHMRLMNFVMLQELMKQLTNFKSSEAMWTSSVKLGGAEVQSPKTRDGITTNGSLSMALCLTSFSLYKSGVRSLTTEEARRRAVKMRVVVWYGTRR